MQRLAFPVLALLSAISAYFAPQAPSRPPKTVAPFPPEEAVAFHANGRILPGSRVQALASAAGHPDALLFGTRHPEGGFDLADAAGSPLRREPVLEARPQGNGTILLRDLDGALIVRDRAGAETRIAANGLAGSWSADGRYLLFVEIAPQEGDPDRTLLRLHDVEASTFETIAVGSSDTAAVLSPDGRHVLFVSGRTGVASFWSVPRTGGVPVQLTNHGPEITRSFVPLPSFDLLWDEDTERVFYESHYGGAPEIHALRLSTDRTRVVENGCVGAGQGLRRVDGGFEYLPSDAATPRFFRGFEVVIDPARSELSHSRAPASSPAGPGPSGGGGDSGWVRSPLKARYAPVYNGFKACFGSHEGHDFMAPRWTQVYAAADGVVTKSVDGYPDFGGGDYGNQVRLTLNGLHYEYAHLQAFTVFQQPLFVQTGMPIGRVGASGSANGVPHLHLQIREKGSIKNLFELKWDPPVDPGPLYAHDLLSELPVSYFHPYLDYGACGLADLPQPDYRIAGPFDTSPPAISEIRLFARKVGGREAKIRCRIQDPSGVYDDTTVPSLGSPLSRGVHVTLWDPNSAVPDVVLGMARVSGNALDGIYESAAFDPGANQSYPNGGFTFLIAADDRAHEGFSFANIGNTGTSEYILVDRIPSQPPRAWTEVEMVDLAVEILSAPSAVVSGHAARVDVRVRNQSTFPYPGGKGELAINPTRSFNNYPWHVKLESFAIPPLQPGGKADLTLDVDLPSLNTIPQHLFVLARGMNDPMIANSSTLRDVQVIPPNPDLVVSAVTAPSLLGLGWTMPVGATIANIGLLPAVGTVQIGAWISLDGDPFNGNGDDIPMGGTCVQINLQPNKSMQVPFQSLPLPLNAAFGFQKLVVCVDTLGGLCGGAPPNSKIPELNELNNCGSIPIEVTAPNLQVGSLSTQSVVGVGSSYSVGMQIENSGGVAAVGPVQLGLWLSLDGNPFNGNGDDIPMGGACVTLDLAPGQSKTFGFQTPPVPLNAKLGPQHFVACVDTTGGPCGGLPPWSKIRELDELDNCLSKSVTVAAPDAQLVSLSFPGGWIGGGAVPVTVTVRNNGPDSVDIPVNVSIGPSFAPTHWFGHVGPGDSQTAVIPTFPPPPSQDCGGTEHWTVNACTNLAIDYKPSNNCKSGSIGVSDPAFDLKLTIFDEPSSTAQGKSISWKVRVENVGNVVSPASGVWFLTGVNCSLGAKHWGCHLGQREFKVTPLGPGESRTYTVSNYKIPCGAYCNQYQFIKAEINYTKNPTDFCLYGNLDEEPLWINCTFPCF